MSSNRRQQILDAAMAQFARFGYRKTTLTDIARACGLGKTALYHYFEGKEELFAEVVAGLGDRALEAMAAAAASASDPESQLRSLVETRFAALGMVRDLPGFSDETARELAPMAENARRSFFEAEAQLVQRILVDGEHRGVFALPSPERATAVVMSALKGAESQLLDVWSEEAVQQLLDDVLDVLFDGLRMRGRR